MIYLVYLRKLKVFLFSTLKKIITYQKNLLYRSTIPNKLNKLFISSKIIAKNNKTSSALGSTISGLLSID